MNFIPADCVHALRSVIIDVRSESEFAEASIPTSVSLPLLNDNERAEVGTLYKQKGPDSARRRGLEIVRPKIATFFRKFAALSGTHDLSEPLPHVLDEAFEQVLATAPAMETATLENSKPTLVFYCWRGGARSQSMAHLAEILGFRTQVITGGHKAFRSVARDFLNSPAYPFELCTVYGLTGSGKTKLIRQWIKEGKPVIDLEALAHHRGSAFGEIGLSTIGRQKDFENNLYWKMIQLAQKGEKLVVVEGESRRIGRCQLPESFLAAMRTGPWIKLDCHLDQRVKNILAEYVDDLSSENRNNLDREAQKSLDAIKKRLGGELHRELSALLVQKNYPEFIRILLLNYYDKQYILSQALAAKYSAVISDSTDWQSIDNLLF